MLGGQYLIGRHRRCRALCFLAGALGLRVVGIKCCHQAVLVGYSADGAGRTILPIPSTIVPSGSRMILLPAANC